MKNLMIQIGNFLFKYRNKLFPIIVVALFAIQFPARTVAGSEQLAIIKDWIALAIVLSGLALRSLVIGFAYIKRGGLNKKVYANNLVTEGLFGVCRNPLYVGNVLIYAGVFILHGAPIVALTGIATFLFIYQCIIYAEENYLRDKFDQGYDNYCSHVNRWLPNLGNYKESVKGMNFNFGRAIKKDYSTITNTLLMLALTQIYKYLTVPNSANYMWNIKLIIGGMVLTGLLALTIRYFKKRPKAKLA